MRAVPRKKPPLTHAPSAERVQDKQHKNQRLAPGLHLGDFQMGAVLPPRGHGNIQKHLIVTTEGEGGATGI